MQRIRKSKDGITLMILIITVIVLAIIVGIVINYGTSEIHDVSNKKTEVELAIIQEAIMQRYALVKSENQLGIEAKPIITNKPAANPSYADYEENQEKTRPTGFVGTRIADPKRTIKNKGFSSVELDSNYSSGDSGLTYEQYYYLLSEDDLLELGLQKSKSEKISNNGERSYIVNYLTGEIFDMVKKKYYKTGTSDGGETYIQPAKITMENKTYDFNDN